MARHKKVKYYKTITKKEWNNTAKSSRTVIGGVKHKLFYDRKKGTFLAPIKVVFKKGKKSWTKYFKTKASAKRAVVGLHNKTRWEATKNSIVKLYK